jgi:hypothetical protein
MDDTSSLPVTYIINLTYDRSKFFLVFFFFLKKKRSTREKTCKEVELLERTQQRRENRIKLKQLKVTVYDDHLCVTHSSKERKEGDEITARKKEKETN